MSLMPDAPISGVNSASLRRAEALDRDIDYYAPMIESNNLPAIALREPFLGNYHDNVIFKA